MTDSSATRNTNGIWAQDDGAGGAVSVMVARSIAANNANGVIAVNPGATVYVGQSTISGNTSVGWSNMGRRVSR